MVFVFELFIPEINSEHDKKKKKPFCGKQDKTLFYVRVIITQYRQSYQFWQSRTKQM